MRPTSGFGLPASDIDNGGVGTTATDAAIAIAESPQPEALGATPERQESLVIQTSFLGDAILTTPLIAELAMRGPVDVVTTPAAAKVLANNPSIRRLWTYDKRGSASGMSGLWRMASDLRGRRGAISPMTGELMAPDARRARGRRAKRIAYLAQGSVRSAVLAMMAGCRERIGFSTSAGRHLYTQRVLYRDDRHHAERLWRLAFPREPNVMPPAGAITPRLYPSERDREHVDALLSAKGFASERLIALAPGSAWATKRWPYYLELARRLAPDVPLAIVGGPDENAIAREIVDAVGAARVLDATGSLSMLGSAALIERAALLITNDSSPQHLASAMGTPTITLFGPTVPEFGFGPLAPSSTSLGHDALACRPCHHHGPQRCPLGHWRCMRELDVERVMSHVIRTSTRGPRG